MKRYNLSLEAQQDLRDIRTYLLKEAGLVVTRHVVRDIAKAMHLLSETPGVGHSREDLTDEQVKFWAVFSYLIIYDPMTRPIGIARILHASQDVKRLFRLKPAS